MAMKREEVEALITEKIKSGDAGDGLYDTGTEYVVADVEYSEGVDPTIKFTWFPLLRTVDDLMND